MRTTTTLLAALAISTATYAQRATTLGGGLEIGIPIGEYQDTWGRQLAGLSANIALPMRRLPLSYGFDFSWAYMGSESAVVAVDEENIESTTGDLDVKCNTYGYHGLLRLQPFQGQVSPYVELMAGVRQFTTRTEITVEGLDEPLMEQRNEDHFVGSTGWAAGLQVHPGKSRTFYLEGRVERLTGGQVTYVDPHSIAVSPEGEVSYGTLTSGSRVVNVTFGIGLRF